MAAAGEHGDIILGNVVGSNIANVGMVIGAAALLTTLLVSRQTVRREIPIMVGFSALLVVMSLDGEISQVDGIIMILILGAFTAYTIRLSRQGGASRAGRSGGPSGGGAHGAQLQAAGGGRERLRLKPFGEMGAGVGLLYLGAILTVDNAVAIAHTFAIPERIIGITVIAIGTSLPELITSVLAIRKGHTDIGVGNIIGSNIYNILMITGVAATLAGIHVAPAIYTDYIIMLAFSMVLFVAIKSGRIARWVGVGLVAGYAAYLISSLAI